MEMMRKELTTIGHSIEARIYAEDPDKGFLPSTGRLLHLAPPPESEHVRVDTGVEQGDAITPHYDPMIAKLIVWDSDRPKALARMRQALAQYRVVGVANNVEFLSRLVKAAGADKPLAHLAQFYVELALPDYGCLRYRGSQLAAAAMYCAIRAMRGAQPGAADCWTHALARHSRYSEADILPCAHALARLQRKAASASLTAVYKKYSNAKFHEVAKLPCPEGLGEDTPAAMSVS
jgi:acetyl/propionyl-CoA carboxylase alpha subunit